MRITMACNRTRAIEDVIEFTYERTSDDEYLGEDFRESIDDAIAAWRRLKQDAGFDLQGVRRRELVPLVLVYPT
jgi:hypothetical protein